MASSTAPAAASVVQRGKELAWKDVQLPPLKEHQVYVRLKWAAFNPTDRLAFDLEAFGDGSVLGCDFAGVVTQAHSSVTTLAPGDNIAAWVWGGEIKGLGAYSRHCVADERLSFKIPPGFSDAQACTIPLAATTACLALFSEDCLSCSQERATGGSCLLIWGGSSVVGQFAIQLASLHGITVATTCSPRNFDLVRQAGAKFVFDYNDKDVIAKIEAVLPQLSHVFDTIGNASSSSTSARALCGRHGILCTVRPGKVNTQGVPAEIKVTDVFVFSAFPWAHTYRGSVHWPVHMRHHELGAEFFKQLPTLLRNGSLKPPAINTLGMLSPSTIEQAMNMNREGKISGQKLCFEVP